MLSGGGQRRALPYLTEEMKILNISFPRVGIETTTCFVRLHSHAFVLYFSFSALIGEVRCLVSLLNTKYLENRTKTGEQSVLKTKLHPLTLLR